MSRVEIDGDTQDALFGIFTLAQDLERRVVRMIARRHSPAAISRPIGVGLCFNP